jgi:hypothetical protein
VINAGNPTIDGRAEFWDTHNKIFDVLNTWDDDCLPVLIPDDDWSNPSFISEKELVLWKDEAQLVAFGGYESILEDGPDISGSMVFTRSCFVRIIIIHLRGLAPKGWMTSPDNRA